MPWDTDAAMLAEAQHAQRHRELRRQLIDARDQHLHAADIRKLVGVSLVGRAEQMAHVAEDCREISEQSNRIGSAIKDCSRARSELAHLRRALEGGRRRRRPLVAQALPLASDGADRSSRVPWVIDRSSPVPQ